jgi:predicted HD phosphohydrolase
VQLELQGGPMTSDEARVLEQFPDSQAAVAVRRWDDRAKDPTGSPPEFGHIRPVLQRLNKFS